MALTIQIDEVSNTQHFLVDGKQLLAMQESVDGEGRDKTATIVFTGNLASSTALNVKAELNMFLKMDYHLVLNLEGLEGMSSTFQRFLIDLQREAERRDLRMVLIHVQDGMMDIFRSSGLHMLLEIE